MRKIFLAVLMVVGAWIDSGQYLRAVDTTWSSPVDGIFGENSNWDTGMVPGFEDTVRFDNAISSQTIVTFRSPHETAGFEVLDADVTLDLSEQPYEVAGPVILEGSLRQRGALRVLGGDFNVNLVDAGSSLIMQVGSDEGNTQFVVGAGGTATINQELRVGTLNSGTQDSVRVENGGRLDVVKNSTAAIVVGGTVGFSNSSGSVTVTGSASELNSSGTIIVGDRAGTGRLDILSGGAVNVPVNPSPVGGSSGIIGWQPGASGLVNVSSGSTWTNVQGLDVGRAGNGTLNISGGSVVSSGRGSVAASTGTTGDVNIDGASSIWTLTDDLAIGGFAASASAGGIATVDVTNGGRLQSTGTIQVRSGSTLSGDGTIEAATVDLRPGSRLSGTSTVAGNLMNSGTVAPGFSPGTMIIDGDFEQGPDGSLEIEVEGLLPGMEHDQLIVGGTATLAGRLDVPVTAASVFPQVNDEITFLNALGGNVMGQFDSLTAPNLAAEAPGLALRINYLPNEVRLQFVAPQANGLSPAGPLVGNWSSLNQWTGEVPDSATSIELNNTSDFFDRRVEVGFNGDQGVFAHELNVSGNTSAMTLVLGGDATLSVTNQTLVGDNGFVSLEGGTLLTGRLEVGGGGTLSGIGRVVGNVSVGIDGSTSAAVLSPGSSPGTMEINGDLQLGSSATSIFELEGEAVGQFDAVDVTGEVTYGGTLVIDASNYNAAPPTVTSLPQFTIVSAASRAADSVFDDVEIINRPAGLGFDIVYSDSTSTAQTAQDLGDDELAAIESGSGNAAEIVFGYLGDMDWDGQLDVADDVPAFVLGLTDPLKYFNEISDIDGVHHPPQALGDVAGDPDGLPDNQFDFDDVDAFSELFSGASAAAIFEMIEFALFEIAMCGGISTDSSIGQAAANPTNDSVECRVGVPEPTTIVLFLFGCLILSAHSTSPCRYAIGTDG